MTVEPATRIARPTVADVAASAASAAAPVPALLALAADVEQRVVDADREADEDDDRGRRRAARGRSARRARARRARPRPTSGRAAAARRPRPARRTRATRITSVIGSEISSAWWSPSLTILLIALSPEPLPASWNVTPGWRGGESIDNVLHLSGATCRALLGSPRSVTTTSAVRPPARDSSAVARALDRRHRRQAAGAGLERGDRVRGPLRAARADEHVLGRGALEARARSGRRRHGPIRRCRIRSSRACACRRSSRGRRTRRSARARARRSSWGDAPRSGPRRGRSGRARRRLPTRRMWWMRGCLHGIGDCLRRPPKSLGRSGVRQAADPRPRWWGKPHPRPRRLCTTPQTPDTRARPRGHERLPRAHVPTPGRAWADFGPCTRWAGVPSGSDAD